jgi:creatinine amidohydrolase
MNAINWMDFKRLVPEKINTVLLPVGTVEAHGAINNGADNTVPTAMARDLAERLNAMYAPTVSYGVTTSLTAFAGGLRISPEVFQPYVEEVIAGLAKTGFKNLIVLNGHGPNFEYLEKACVSVSENTGVRTVVLNWWSLTADITKDVYGQDGGHAGINETAAVQATNPEYIQLENYKKEIAWWSQEGLSAYPFPSSIILYKPEEGYPDFNEPRAQEFYGRVLDRLEKLIKTTIEKWELAGL